MAVSFALDIQRVHVKVVLLVVLVQADRVLRSAHSGGRALAVKRDQVTALAVQQHLIFRAVSAAFAGSDHQNDQDHLKSCLHFVWFFGSQFAAYTQITGTR